MKKYFFSILIGAFAASIILGGCKKLFDKVPENQLGNGEAYQNVYDADAAVMGIYGKFMSLADRYVILNELRADLLDYTNKADKYLRQVSSHTVTEDNPYANPRPFYELIINCNDVLLNLSKMHNEKKISDADYNERFSDIACLRSFLYLQLGIHWGDQVRYVTSPLADINDLKNESLFPRVTFDVLLDSLIAFTDPIPYKDQYSSASTLNITLDGYPTSKFFINKLALLGDLHLWKGNYNKAATYYRQLMEVATTGTKGESYYSQYKMGWYGNADAPITDNRVAFVTRSRAGDINALLYDQGWRTMFEAGYTANNFIREWIWVLPFDNKFAPANPLIKLFSPIGGDYLVKPSQQIMDMWDDQQMGSSAIPGSGLPYDVRGLFSVKEINGQRVVMKYLYKYLNWQSNMPVDVLVKNGDWFLLRQTHLHLRFAEAANRDGRHKLASAFLNNGIGGAFNDAANPDKTNLMNTLSYPYPYNFDARNGAIPYFRGDWYRHDGIRSRALLTGYPITATNTLDSTIQIEDGIVQEGALENAFEGTRYADLLRIARRRNDPAFLADKVYQKLLKDGDPNAAAARAKLMNRDNWYLPFKWD